MRLAKWKMVAGSCLMAAVLSLPAWGDTDTGHTAMPGTLNYVEGQAAMGTQNLGAQAVGKANLENGQVLETGNGKAEILLTPGVYLRLGSNSSVKMVNDSLTDTQVSLRQGEAMLEVDELYKENFIHVTQPGADTRVVKTGLYDFDAANNTVRVFDGKAIVNADDKNTTVKKDHEVNLSDAKIKSHGFNQKQLTQNDDLYRWSSLRSEYLSEANVQTAQQYYMNGWYGPGWWGPGWYWDPWFAGYTFLPGDGFFYNPFGWGFYSPLMAWRAPFVVGGGYHHFDGARPVAIGRGFHDHAVTAFRGGRGMMGRPAGGFRGGMMAGGFHGGGMGGEMHMGGGGFGHR